MLRTYAVRANEIRREEGLSTLLGKIPPFVYKQLWPYLPKDGYVEYNGVRIAERKDALSTHLPASITRYVPGDDPEYEKLYVACLEDYLDPGQRAVLIGGGEGVSTVAAARQVGPDGTVSVYEGSRSEVEKTAAAVQLNDVADRVSVHHAIVGDEVVLRGAADGASVVAPGDLPECDVLAVDVDGAELSILADLAARPERLVVEHHPVLGDTDTGELIFEYQPETVRAAIRDLGYRILEERSHPTWAYGEYEERIFVAERA